MTDTGDMLGQRMLAAIMFTDVVGFSRHASEDEERALRLLQRDLQAIADLCTRFSGQVVKNTGDGMMLLFTSGVQAVECAQAIQRHFTEQQSLLPRAEVLQHRIGIHLGDVFVNNGEVMGDGVNIAARLQTEAPPGGICISQALYEVVRARLSLQTVEIGTRQLKNIAEGVVVYQVVVAGQPQQSRPRGASPVPAAPSSPGIPSWAWMIAGVVVLAVAALLIVPPLLRRSTPPGTPHTATAPGGMTQPGGPPPVNGGTSGQPGGPPPVQGMSGNQPGGPPANMTPPPSASTGDPDTLRANRDYAGYVAWMRGQGYEQGTPAQQAELRKYQQFADFLRWVSMEMSRYSEASPLTWNSPRGGAMKAWAMPDGRVMVESSERGRISVSLQRVQQPALIVSLAAALARAQWGDGNVDPRIAESLEAFASEHQVQAGQAVERMRGNRGR